MIEHYKVNSKTITIVVGDNDIMISGSKDIKSVKEMNQVIHHIFIKYNHKLSISDRTKANVLAEWRTHNLLYALGIFRSHTKDVNLEYKQNKILTILYAILSVFYFHYN